MAGIYTYGETVHMFIERKNYDGPIYAGYEKWNLIITPQIVDCFM